MSVSKNEDLRTLWKRALLLTHEGHWLKSEVAELAFTRANGDPQIAYRILSEIGVPDGSKRMLKSMQEARQAVPDRDVWIAAGWDRVRRLVAMSATERKRAIGAIRKEIKAGTKPKRAAAKILPNPAPKPRPTQAPTPVAAPPAKPGLLDLTLADLADICMSQPVLLKGLNPRVRAEVEPLLKKAKRGA